MRDEDGRKMSSQGWAMRIERRDVAAAGRLRQVTGVEVCEQADAVWLRGPQSGDELQWQLAAVAGARRFSVLADGQLLPVGARVPRGWLPQGPWTALGQWMGLASPPVRLAGRGDATVLPALIRSDRVEEASLLLVRFDLWAAYALEAPQIRLDHWRFAVAADGRAAVHDQPQSRQVENVSYALPPLPGQRWVEREGIAVPAGWTWTPAVEAAIMREVFGLAEGDVALWHCDGGWERIAGEDFVRATRAAVRETGKNFA
jgi:hypothetical protein